MVNPGGTGSPRLVISARFAPLPPSRSFWSLLPSLKSKTHLVDCFTSPAVPLLTMHLRLQTSQTSGRDRRELIVPDLTIDREGERRDPPHPGQATSQNPRTAKTITSSTTSVPTISPVRFRGDGAGGR